MSHARNLDPIDPSIMDVVLLPALMVDNCGNRLGYGAGYYDRFIPGLRKDCVKIVPLPNELFISSLPNDHWDIPVKAIVTQEKTIFLHQKRYENLLIFPGFLSKC